MMRNIINAFMVIIFLSLFVSCTIGGKQGKDGASNEQPSANVPVRGDKTVNLDLLPQVTKNYIDKYLSDKEIAKVIAEEDELKVWFSTGEQLEFDLDGNIKKIESPIGVSASVIDERILQDIKSIDPNLTIVRIEMENNGDFDVKLDNGKEITYDANYKRIGFDD